MIKKYIECGQIVGTHGIRGEVKINPWSDNPKFLVNFKTFYLDENGTEKLETTSVRTQNNMVLAKFTGYDTIEKATELKNKVIFIHRDNANIGDRHFIQEIIGCKAYDFNTNEYLGDVTDAYNMPANDVWQITKDERDYLLPAIDEVVKSVDIEKGIVIINPMKGIFDDED